MSAKHKPSAANAAPSQSSSKSLSLGAPPRGRGGGAEVTMGGGKLSSSVTAYEGSSKCQKPALLHVLRQRHMQRHITTRGTANYPDVLLTRRDPLDSEDARLDSGLGALGGAPLGDVAGLSAGDPRLTSS
ncbi:hypothetical protein NP493_185g02003 [Ridgeia piscesae]|uniref:Uncharacterized protein n=1 Tax=Ridgeia piscesae TaxID=27915 RepID=A0AAD9P2K9_RIDPI|nr:hypothetical protein NP493_185g02003 [Ridgeia piscesae]